MGPSTELSVAYMEGVPPANTIIVVIFVISILGNNVMTYIGLHLI